jgi:hypothetical protein
LNGGFRFGPGGSLEQELPLPGIPGERGGAFEFRSGFVQSPEFAEQVAPDCRQEVVPFERPYAHERVRQLQARGGPLRHANRNGTVQLYYRRWREPRQLLI